MVVPSSTGILKENVTLNGPVLRRWDIPDMMEVHLNCVAESRRYDHTAHDNLKTQSYPQGEITSTMGFNTALSVRNAHVRHMTEWINRTR